MIPETTIRCFLKTLIRAFESIIQFKLILTIYLTEALVYSKRMSSKEIPRRALLSICLTRRPRAPKMWFLA